MQTYGQKDFTQTIGTGEETIAESGAMLVAFANLLNRMGYEYDPQAINLLLSTKQLHPELGLFLGEISAIEPTLSVSERGSGAPNEDESIVVLVYHSDYVGGTVTTYAAVSDAAKGLIIDSYDGEEKHWDVYGGPKAYVNFSDDKGSPILPTPFKAKPVVPALTKHYEVVVKVDGYATELDASIKNNHIVELVPGSYLDVTEGESNFKRLSPGLNLDSYWIDPSDNVDPESVKVDEPIIETPVTELPVSDTQTPSSITTDTPKDEDQSITVRVVPSTPENWKASWTAFLSEVEYMAEGVTVIKDMDGTYGNVILPEGIVKLAGYFYKGGDKFYRTQKSVDAENWYAVPENIVHRIKTDAEIDDVISTAGGVLTSASSSISRAVKKAGSADGRFRGMFKKK